MHKKELVIPFYCFSCGNLSFVHRQNGQEQTNIIDYAADEWKVHTCYSIHPKRFTDSQHIQNLQSVDWGSDRLPFVHRIQPENRRQRKFSFGIVISLPPRSSKDQYFKVLTLENSIVEIRTVQKEIPDSCGRLIDISDMVRIGKGKYRQASIKYGTVSEYQKMSSRALRDVYQIKVSSNDQEQLEAFINRLLKAFLSRQISPLSIVPLKITKEAQKKVHHRQITIPPDSDFYVTIEKTDVPEFIHFSVKQIKFPTAKSNTLIDA